MVLCGYGNPETIPVPECTCDRISMVLPVPVSFPTRKPPPPPLLVELACVILSWRIFGVTLTYTMVQLLYSIYGDAHIQACTYLYNTTCECV
jgi:hypothetical protein